MKIILKFRNHPIIFTAKKDAQFIFHFQKYTKQKTKYILNLDISKTSQDTDVYTRVIKENEDIFFRIFSFKF